jgi:ABC-type transporter Mla subunit MlaD
MPDINTIEQGLGLDSLIGSNAPAEAFGALTSNVASKVATALGPYSKTGVIAKLNEIATNTDRPQQLVDALVRSLNDMAATLDNQIQADLTAQQSIRQSQQVDDLATQIIPAISGTSPLFDLVTTPSFKQVYGKQA